MDDSLYINSRLGQGTPQLGQWGQVERSGLAVALASWSHEIGLWECVVVPLDAPEAELEIRHSFNKQILGALLMQGRGFL